MHLERYGIICTYYKNLLKSRAVKKNEVNWRLSPLYSLQINGFLKLNSRFAHHSVLLAKHSEFSSRNCLHVCIQIYTHTHTHIYTLYTASQNIYYIYLYKYNEHFLHPPTPATCFLVFDFFFLYIENREFQNFYIHFSKQV